MVISVSFRWPRLNFNPVIQRYLASKHGRLDFNAVISRLRVILTHFCWLTMPSFVMLEGLISIKSTFFQHFSNSISENDELTFSSFGRGKQLGKQICGMYRTFVVMKFCIKKSLIKQKK